MTVKEVALLVKLSVVTIRRYTMRNEIPFHKIYRAVRYKKSEIEEWVEKREAAEARKQEKTAEQKNKDDLFSIENIVGDGTGGNE